MKHKLKVIDVEKDFSANPGLRYKYQSLWSGEEFKEILSKYLDKGFDLVIVIDGPKGMGDSFMEGAFIELVREQGPDIINRLHFQSVTRPRRIARVLDKISKITNQSS